MRQVWRLMGECYRSVKSSAVLPKVDGSEKDAGQSKEVIKPTLHSAIVKGDVQE
jgi:hypothetical protein